MYVNSRFRDTFCMYYVYIFARRCFPHEAGLCNLYAINLKLET